MERKPPGQDHEPEVVIDAPDDARGYNQAGWSLGQIVFILIALAMLAAGLMWVGSLVGLVAQVLPGGQGEAGGAVWGGVGAIGVVILVLIVAGMRRTRRPLK